MTIQKCFAELIEEMDGLQRSLDHLLFAVVEAQPEPDQGNSLVDHYDSVTEDLIGLMKEAVVAVEAGLSGTGRDFDLPKANRALMDCHERLLDVSEQFYRQLFSLENLENLGSLVQEDAATWQPWVKGVTDALDYCLRPLQVVNRALFNCWQSLSEHDGRVAISVKNVNTGQQINLSDEQMARVKTQL